MIPVLNSWLSKCYKVDINFLISCTSCSLVLMGGTILWYIFITNAFWCILHAKKLQISLIWNRRRNVMLWVCTCIFKCINTGVHKTLSYRRSNIAKPSKIMFGCKIGETAPDKWQKWGEVSSQGAKTIKKWQMGNQIVEVVTQASLTIYLHISLKQLAT